MIFFIISVTYRIYIFIGKRLCFALVLISLFSLFQGEEVQAYLCADCEASGEAEAAGSAFTRPCLKVSDDDDGEDDDEEEEDGEDDGDEG